MGNYSGTECCESYEAKHRAGGGRVLCLSAWLFEISSRSTVTKRDFTWDVRAAPTEPKHNCITRHIKCKVHVGHCPSGLHGSARLCSETLPSLGLNLQILQTPLLVFFLCLFVFNGGKRRYLIADHSELHESLSPQWEVNNGYLHALQKYFQSALDTVF